MCIRWAEFGAEVPFPWYGGVGGLGGYEEETAAEIEGDVAECRTRLTSFFPSADQRSTVSTKKVVSMSLRASSVSSAPLVQNTVWTTTSTEIGVQ